MKCEIDACPNTTDEGEFVGDLCYPCDQARRESMTWTCYLSDLEEAIKREDCKRETPYKLDIPESLVDAFCMAEAIVGEHWEAKDEA